MTSTLHSVRKLVLGPAILLLLGGAALSANASAPRANPITPAGVGGVELGEKFSVIRKSGLVGPRRPGCELAPNTRLAELKPPLQGVVNLTTDPGPRRVSDIQVTGGANARGVRVGSKKSAVKKAYPKAKFKHSTEDVFGITLVRIKRGDGGRLQMAVSVETKKVTLIGIPRLAFCE